MVKIGPLADVIIDDDLPYYMGQNQTSDNYVIRIACTRLGLKGSRVDADLRSRLNNELRGRGYNRSLSGEKH